MAPPQALKFTAFLSYRSSDAELATWLHRKLEGYRVPRRLVGQQRRWGPVPRRLGPIFRDRADARSAEDIESAIRGFLAQSRHLVVLCTPAAAQPASWVPREIEIFREERNDGAIHAVIGGGQPPECFPPVLLRTGPDDRHHAPLAPDLRPRSAGGDGRRRALVKLVASLIDVDFDELWQRDLRRRWLTGAAAGVLAMAALSGSATWLDQYEASRRKNIGETAQALDSSTNPAFKDLLTIAAGPPPDHPFARATAAQHQAIEAIARRLRASYAGTAFHLHAQHSEQPDTPSADGRFVLAMAPREQHSAWIWDIATGETTARLPLSARHWLPPQAVAGFRREHAQALAASADLRLIAAIHAPDERRPKLRTLAVWRLDERRSCDDPACRPVTFALEHAGTGPDFEPGSEMLKVDPEGTYGVHTASGLLPHRVDLRTGRTESFSDDGSGCVAALPELPSAAIHEEPSPSQPSSPAGASHWFSDDAATIARLPEGGRILTFFSASTRAPVARLNLPSNASCNTRCSVDVLFPDRSTAIVTGTFAPPFASGAVNRLATFHIDSCRLEAWPDGGLARRIAELPRHRGQALKLESEGPYKTSRDGTYLAANIAFTDGEAPGRIALMDVARRAMLPLLELPHGWSKGGLDRGDKPDSFVAFTDAGFVPVGPDGVGMPELVESGNARSLWRAPGYWETWVGDGTFRWTRRGASGGPSRSLLARGDKLGPAVVSADGRRLAVAQGALVHVQPTEPASKRTAVTLHADNGWLRALRLSPDGRLVAAAWHRGTGDNAPASIAVWNGDDGRTVTTYTLDTPARLLEVENDGAVLVEIQGKLLGLKPRDGSQQLIAPASEGRWYLARSPAQRGPAFVAQAGASAPLALDSALRATALTAPAVDGGVPIAVAPDGRTGYFSDSFLDAFGDLASGERRVFLRGTRTGPHAFSPDSKFAIEVRRGGNHVIEFWDPAGPRLLERFAGPWNETLALWFTPDARELRALDDSGAFHRWVLTPPYADSMATACAALAKAQSRLRFTDEEMALVSALRESERAPCSRSGIR